MTFLAPSRDFVFYHQAAFSFLTGFTNGIWQIKRLDWIEKEAEGRGELLDLGAGTGDFLVRAQKKGWKSS